MPKGRSVLELDHLQAPCLGAPAVAALAAGGAGNFEAGDQAVYVPGCHGGGGGGGGREVDPGYICCCWHMIVADHGVWGCTDGGQAARRKAPLWGQRPRVQAAQPDLFDAAPREGLHHLRQCGSLLDSAPGAGDGTQACRGGGRGGDGKRGDV